MTRDAGKEATEEMEKYLASGREEHREKADMLFMQVIVEELRNIGNKVQSISEAIDRLGRNTK